MHFLSLIFHLLKRIHKERMSSSWKPHQKNSPFSRQLTNCYVLLSDLGQQTVLMQIICFNPNSCKICGWCFPNPYNLQDMQVSASNPPNLATHEGRCFQPPPPLQQMWVGVFQSPKTCKICRWVFFNPPQNLQDMLWVFFNTPRNLQDMQVGVFQSFQNLQDMRVGVFQSSRTLQNMFVFSQARDLVRLVSTRWTITCTWSNKLVSTKTSSSNVNRI